MTIQKNPSEEPLRETPLKDLRGRLTGSERHLINNGINYNCQLQIAISQFPSENCDKYRTKPWYSRLGTVYWRLRTEASLPPHDPPIQNAREQKVHDDGHDQKCAIRRGGSMVRIARSDSDQLKYHTRQEQTNEYADLGFFIKDIMIGTG